MPFGADYRILLSGDVGEASRWVPTGRAWASRLELLMPGEPTAKKWRLTKLVRMEIQCIPGVDRWIHITAEPPCENFPGGFLQWRGDTGTSHPGAFWLLYTDGKEAIIGQDEGPDLEAQKRARDVELAEQPFSSDPRHPHFYTGRIRIAVQCEHLLGKTTALLHYWTRSHGVYDPNPEPEPFDPAHPEEVDMDDYEERACWLIEISSDGVYAYPIDWRGRCCDSLDYVDLLPTNEEVVANPAILPFRTQLSLKWAMDNARIGVQQMATAGDVQDIFTPYSPWYSGQAWAFSYSGREAQNVGYRLKSDRYLTSRWKFTFQYDENQKKVIMVRTQLTADATCTFWKAGLSAKSVFWVPELTDPLGVTWNAVPPFVPLPGLAPIFVYYDGEVERVMTFEYKTVGAHTDKDPQFDSPPSVFNELGNKTNCTQQILPGPTYRNQVWGEFVPHSLLNKAYSAHNQVFVGSTGFKVISGDEATLTSQLKQKEFITDYVYVVNEEAAPAVWNNECSPGLGAGAVVSLRSHNYTLMYCGNSLITSRVQSILTHCAAMPDRESFSLFKHDSEVGTPAGGGGTECGGLLYLEELLAVYVNEPNGPNGAPAIINASEHLVTSNSAPPPAPFFAQGVLLFEGRHPASEQNYLRKNYDCFLLGRGAERATYSTSSSDPAVAYNVVDIQLRPFYLYTTTNTRVQSPISLIQSGLREAENYFLIWDLKTIGLVKGYPTNNLSTSRRHFFLGRQ